MPPKPGTSPWNKGLKGVTSHNEETRKKISETNKKVGVGKWMKGRHLTEEAKKKQSEALKGNKSHLWIDGRSNDSQYLRDAKWKWKVKKQEKIAGRSRPNECELCEGKVKICFDHDHQTGKFRGWICHRCNLAIAFANDDVELLEKMIKYLK